MNCRQVILFLFFHFVTVSTLLVPINGTASSVHDTQQKDFAWEMIIPAITSTPVLSPAQSAFLNQLGYPQQFTKTFSDEGGRRRVDEIWVYSKQKVIECFINGILVEEKSFSGTYPTAMPSMHKPEIFKYSTTVDDIISLYGQPATIKQETIWNGSLQTYVYDSIFFVFNNGSLVSLTALK